MSRTEMTTSEYRCLAAHMMYWDRGLQEALKDTNLTHLSRFVVLDQLFKAGYNYNEATDKLIYEENFPDEDGIDYNALSYRLAFDHIAPDLTNCIVGYTELGTRADGGVLRKTLWARITMYTNDRYFGTNIHTNESVILSRNADLIHTVLPKTFK